MTEDARKAANKNDCVRARKCMLVPYTAENNKENAKSVKINGQTYHEQEKGDGGNFFTLMGMGTSAGCCPGQTGHHLIPDSWAKNANCTNYSKSTAPVVCAEGVSQNDGSHKSLHYNLNNQLEKQVEKKEIANKDTENFTQDEIFNLAAESHSKTFPKSGDCTLCIGTHPCDKDCIKVQLKDYYNCESFKPEPIPQSKEVGNGKNNKQ